MFFVILLGVAGFIGGCAAAVAGAGVGSVLTPIFAAQQTMNLAVAAVALPHFLSTLVRFWSLRRQVDLTILKYFGIASAVGGLAGALLQQYAGGEILIVVFGVLLILAGLYGIFGHLERIRFGPKSAWFGGILTGFFGGLVGEQGGIRSAALLGFHMSKEAFVATATATALIIDGIRLPIYYVIHRSNLVQLWPYILVMSGGTILGTFLGISLLKRVPREAFTRIVSGIIIIIGILVLLKL